MFTLFNFSSFFRCSLLFFGGFTPYNPLLFSPQLRFFGTYPLLFILLFFVFSFLFVLLFSEFSELIPLLFGGYHSSLFFSDFSEGYHSSLFLSDFSEVIPLVFGGYHSSLSFSDFSEGSVVASNFISLICVGVFSFFIIILSLFRLFFLLSLPLLSSSASSSRSLFVLFLPSPQIQFWEDAKCESMTTGSNCSNSTNCSNFREQLQGTT